MRCEEIRPLLHPFVDDELDLPHSLEVQRHLEGCPACARGQAALQALRPALRDPSLYFKPREQFTARARAALRAAARSADPERAPRRVRWLWTPAWAAAAVLAVSAVTVWNLAPWAPALTADNLLGREVIASHVRSLMADHLTDVPSSDQHTVKPWFNGRLDFSPPVKDLSDEGFPLAGGRLDYLAGRPVAALVYQRRRHVINLMVWPVPHEADRNMTAEKTQQGYHLLHWVRDGMSYWAVSDLNEDELRRFVRLVQR